jgi:hypothetical protein
MTGRREKTSTPERTNVRDGVEIFSQRTRRLKLTLSGGRGGIRTPGTVTSPTVFKTVAIDHSATLPDENRLNNSHKAL